MVSTARSRTEDAPEGRGWLRPQSVIFTLLAEHLLGSDLAVFSGSFIEILGRLGVGEHATRATLARMVRRGLLQRERRGRRAYLRMTARCVALLEDGRERIWEAGAINGAQPGVFTLLTFSLPQSWHRKRYYLRAKLTWAGFGPLQNGVWLAPSEVNVAPLVAQLGLSDHVRLFHTRPLPPTDPASLVREAFDLDVLSERYRLFTEAWKQGGTEARDSLVLTLTLSTQWLQTIRDDPRVPVQLLPADWPAIEAQRLFRELHGAHRPAAARLARRLLETA